MENIAYPINVPVGGAAFKTGEPRSADDKISNFTSLFIDYPDSDVSDIPQFRYPAER